MSSGIQMFLNCRKCVQETPKGQSAASYSRLHVGLVEEGLLRVWCFRHNERVMDVSVNLAMPECGDPDHA